jgi:hypothetical protein
MELRVSLALVAASAGLAFAGPQAAPHPAPPAGALPGAASLVVADTADATHCGGRDVTVRALPRATAGVEPELIVAMTLDAPRGLDFDPQHEDAQKASEKRFSDWFTDATKKMSVARRLYDNRLTDVRAHAADRVVAIARIAQLDRRFADLIARMEIPASVRTGAYAADATAAFCDAVTEKAQPLYDKADDDAKACRKAAADAKLGPGWWDVACAP